MSGVKCQRLQRGALLLKLADTLAAHREGFGSTEGVCSGKTILLSRAVLNSISQWLPALLCRLGGKNNR